MSVVYMSRKAGKVFHELWCPYIARLDRSEYITIDEGKAVHDGYCPCKFCRSVKGYVYKYKDLEGGEVSYDPVDDALCVKTNVGFWKVLWSESSLEWRLFHMNHAGWKGFDANKPAKELMRGSFHRQEDMKTSRSLTRILEYIIRHDKDYYWVKIHGVDKLPRKTKKQKKYYKRVKKIQQKDAVRRVYELLDSVS